MTPLMHLEIGRGGHDGWGGGHLLLPFLGLLALALVAFALFSLVRSGRLDLGRLGRPRPEDEAKRVLAERFGRGDISPEEFLERSSLLNWTPGVDAAAPRSGWLRRR